MKRIFKWLAGLAVAAGCYVAEVSHNAYETEVWQVDAATNVQPSEDEYTIVRRRVVTGKRKDLDRGVRADQLLARYGQ